MFIPLLRIIKFAFQNFFRNFWLSIITITILVLTLFSINILVLLNFLTSTAISSVQEKIDVSVYFYPEAAEESVQNVRSYLIGLSQVRDVKYISREEALEKFRENHGENESIISSLEELEENPLGATLVIKTHNPNDYPFVLETLDNPEFTQFVQDKNYDDHKEIIERIDRITDRVRNFGIILSGIFVMIAVLIVINTIRVAIYTHREEIGIMKLVGASNWFVRMPFLAEGVLYAFLATLVIIGIIYPLSFFAEPYISGFFETESVGMIDYLNHNFLWIFVTQFVAMSVLNIISTGFALGRYLKV
ncbi:FtsX-like permease family protein [Candidatus Saccharibacteria bacterium]|nr:FtsX-like permease family protein [Candidatus Saccharibacteria bacterium]NIS37703.1 FtsX-like permease family protein [Candidatus Saccharibacteria bacterium]NIV03197.1 FtsX-like permease family protein [Calditrichia bacterium]NIV97797.1 FtsX-like permease family protein [Candidatus Saccharibacteria bacterium]NIW78077.1 FtsX-like permease family protein [Calditrichia bacterium]